MNKVELVKVIAERSGFTQKDVKEVVDCLETSIIEALGVGEDVKTGIGTFSVKQTNARKARNPKTGETVDVPAGRKVSMKLSKAIKDSVK